MLKYLKQLSILVLCKLHGAILYRYLHISKPIYVPQYTWTCERNISLVPCITVIVPLATCCNGGPIDTCTVILALHHPRPRPVFTNHS